MVRKRHDAGERLEEMQRITRNLHCPAGSDLDLDCIGRLVCAEEFIARARGSDSRLVLAYSYR